MGVRTRKSPGALAVLVLILFACLSAGTLEPAAAQEAKPAGAEKDARLALGKKLFVARCASCHNERGDKPLASGLPLAERKLSDAVIEQNVSGRFRSATDEEKRAVIAYVKSFMKSRE